MIEKCPHICSNKSASEYCNSTACVNPKYSNIGTAQYGQGVLKRIVTNADRIRAMSDEELAQCVERISMMCANEYCGKACPLFELCMSSAEKPSRTLDWLKQEAKT